MNKLLLYEICTLCVRFPANIDNILYIQSSLATDSSASSWQNVGVSDSIIYTSCIDVFLVFNCLNALNVHTSVLTDWL